MKTKLLLCSALAVLLAQPAQAVVVALAADKDTSIFQNNVNNSAGGGPGIFAGTNGTNSPRRALISFNVAGSVPAGATITNVQLTLTLGQSSSSTTATIGLFNLTQNWGEGTTGSTATTIGGTGQGFAANAGDATWNAAFYPGTTWTAAGGDHAAAASASLLLGNNTIGNSFTWPSTAQTVADVQSWLNNPATNYGWELLNANETTSNSLFGFYSSEWRTFPGGSASQEPVLQVTYTVPEPVAGSLLLCAGAAFFSLRPRRHPR